MYYAKRYDGSKNKPTRVIYVDRNYATRVCTYAFKGRRAFELGRIPQISGFDVEIIGRRQPALLV